MTKENHDPWEELAKAIIIQAANDWRKANQKLKRYSDNGFAKSELADIEKFFLGKWYAALTDVPGDKLLRMLREEAENDC